MAEHLESSLKVDLNESCRCSELQKELETTKVKLHIAEKEVAKLERQIAITDGYNEDLRRQVDLLSAQLHSFKSAAKTTITVCDASTECEEQQHAGEGDANGKVILNPAVLMDSESGDHSLVCAPPFQDQLTELQNSETPAESVKSMMDEIRETSESAVAQSAFVYDPETGLYYDSQSGYYYDAEKSLYYDVYSGCYYHYDCSTQNYQFHSQVDYAKYSTLSHVILNRANNNEGQADGDPKSSSQGKTKKPKRLRRQERDRISQRVHSHETNTMDDSYEKFQQTDLGIYLRKKLKRHKQMKRNAKASSPANESLVKYCSELLGKELIDSPVQSGDLKEKSGLTMLPVGKEDIGSAGESGSDSMTDCSGLEVELEEGELSSSSASSDDSEEYQSCAEEKVAPEFLRCTPCIRVIVKKSDFLPYGNLYIVTCTAAASIGRDESLNHAILIPDPVLSKMHCEIKYDEELQRYVIRDHATQCGTFVNGRRLSEVKVMSDPCTLYNGDTLQIGQTVLDLHIHPGHDTCMDCEPGNLLGREPLSGEKENVVVVSKQEKEQQRRKQVKAMKKKYGIQSVDFAVNDQPMNVTRYQDRAADRRAKHGSDNPHQKDDIPASVHRPIASENVGHKLLSKMGWKEGESIGKTQQGITEPIQASLRYDVSAGFGTEGNLTSAGDVIHVHSSKKWMKARQRYNKISAREDDTIEERKQSSTAEDERKSDPMSSNTASVYKRLWVKGDDVEPSAVT